MLIRLSSQKTIRRPSPKWPANEIASFSYRVHEQMFPPGHTLRVEGIFSAAVAANFVSIDVVGYILTPEFWPIKQF